MLEEVLTYGREIGASDIHIIENETIFFRINGRLYENKNFKLDSDSFFEIFLHNGESIINNKIFYADKDFAYIDKRNYRYRVSTFLSMNKLGIVIRIISNTAPKLKNNFINRILDEKILNLRDGLVLVTGITGSGKSTTLANIIEKFNNNKQYKILTIEDPVEYVYKNNLSLIIQREIGKDTVSFEEALKSSLRQDPDVVMVGEIRDKDSLKAVLKLSETGHLVFSTLHTIDAVESINRILSMVSENEKEYTREQIASVLRFIFSQDLIEINGKMNPIFEVLNNTKAISNLILNNKLNQIPYFIESGIENFMITKDKYKKLLE